MTVANPAGETRPSQVRKPNQNPLRPLRRPRPAGSASALIARDRLLSARSTTRPVPSPVPRPGNRQAPTIDALRQLHGGWSTPEPPGAQTFPVFATKRELRAGYRYHVMRFVRPRLLEEDKPVDPCDQDEFTRPVTLHRRDPQQPPPGRAGKEAEPQPPSLDEKEAERLAQLRADRDAQKAIDQAKIAPMAKEAAVSRASKHKDDKVMLNRAPKTEAGKKASDLRYEESMPWHLEDADGKNVWVGSYIAALSEANTAVANVAFVIDRPGFRMIPLEKWYKFTSKPPFTPFSIDQAEELMSRKTDLGRWMMKDMEKQQMQEEWAATRKFLQPAGVKKEATHKKAEHDEMDLSGDDFQDDDEAPGWEANDNEEEKDSKARIRREQLGANLFGDGDEHKVDKEEEEEFREEENRRKHGKQLKKALIKREHDDRYDSGSSNGDPFESSSEDESTDEDEKEGDGKKDEDDKKNGKKDEDDKKSVKSEPKEKPNNTTVASKPPSTPTKLKQLDPAKKVKSLKRPGSPTISDSSGTESRKKPKKGGAASGVSRSATPVPSGSGPGGASAAHPKSKLGAEATSDGEASSTAAAPTGEPSDGRHKKKKIRLGGGGAGLDKEDTPSTSRAGSPNPASQGTPPTSLIEPWEIVKALPALPDGISIGNLMKSFQSRIGEKAGLMDRKEWIKLVKANAVWGADKLLRRKDEAAA